MDNQIPQGLTKAIGDTPADLIFQSEFLKPLKATVFEMIGSLIPLILLIPILMLSFFQKVALQGGKLILTGNQGGAFTYIGLGVGVIFAFICGKNLAKSIYECIAPGPWYAITARNLIIHSKGKIRTMSWSRMREEVQISKYPGSLNEITLSYAIERPADDEQTEEKEVVISGVPNPDQLAQIITRNIKGNNPQQAKDA